MKHLCLLLCLTGAVPFALSVMQPRHVFWVIKNPLTWSAAANYCRGNFIDLIDVQYPSWLKTLDTYLASLGLTLSPTWIGLYNDIDSWRWSFNNLLLTSTAVTFWDPGQPDNYKGCEACGAIFSPGNWEDSNCSTLKPFICYDASSSGAASFVGVSSPQLSWTDAQTYCRTKYTDLASALTQADNDLLAQVASGQGPSWFGLYRDTWKWLNNTPTSKLPWLPGQPDNNNSRENCGAMFNGSFSDEDCSSPRNFICDSIIPLRKRKILSLQLKSDGSVFDPAVQSSILKLINQTMKNNGMWSTKMVWRVQPNGNIFNKKISDGM